MEKNFKTLDDVYEYLAEQELQAVKEINNLQFAFSENVLKATVVKLLQKRLIYAKEKLEWCYIRNDELRSAGVSFSARQAELLPKTKRYLWALDYYRDLLGRFKVRKFHKWIEKGDYNDMKKRGFTDFMDYRLFDAIYV